MIRKDKDRIAALTEDIVELLARFDYKITRDFAYTVLSASDRVTKKTHVNLCRHEATRRRHLRRASHRHRASF